MNRPQMASLRLVLVLTGRDSDLYLYFKVERYAKSRSDQQRSWDGCGCVWDVDTRTCTVHGVVTLLESRIFVLVHVHNIVCLIV